MSCRSENRERGGTYLAVLVTIGIALLVVAGLRMAGGHASEKYRCQGQAVSGIGAGGGPGAHCGQREILAGASGVDALAGGSGEDLLGPPGAGERSGSSDEWNVSPMNWEVDDIQAAGYGFAAATIFFKATTWLGTAATTGAVITSTGWALIGLGTAAAVGGVTYAMMPDSMQAQVRSRLRQTWRDVGGPDAWKKAQRSWNQFDQWAQKPRF